ncbi:hypothetical protein K458DRAFT_434239 [Lentithecium fluviatile CBS 122367]|uniref:Uncharacterized protein n=1 Tax=Lentithecium fluviatile CBS 122367 TaxID=1168545 RepID=A0A6G1IRP9_9PLEO|nr:hypothetical protein K458DRAFT_434239 [Lentithecium fluviatile CBS 122367]
MKFSVISRLSALALISMPSAVLVQGRDVCYTEKRDRYPYAVTEWYCSSGQSCCSVPDTSEDGELLWGCIDTGKTCSMDAYLASDNLGFEVTDDGYGDDSDDGDNGDSNGGARWSVASLPAVMSQGQWKEAEELNGQVIEIKKVLRAKHPSTLTSVANLASTYRNQGRWKEAEELEVQVMETSSRVLGTSILPR